MAVNSPPFTHLLTFLLPADARRNIVVPHTGWPFGSLVEVSRLGLVSIMGRSREAVFDAAAAVLCPACRGLPRQSVAMRLYTLRVARDEDTRDWLHVATDSLGAVDGWSAIVGAEVAFSPTALDPYFPNLESRAQPAPKAQQR